MMWKDAWVVGGYSPTAYKPSYLVIIYGDELKWKGDINKAHHFDSEADALAVVAELRERSRSRIGRFFVKRRIVAA